MYYAFLLGNHAHDQRLDTGMLLGPADGPALQRRLDFPVADLGEILVELLDALEARRRVRDHHAVGGVVELPRGLAAAGGSGDDHLPCAAISDR